MTQLIVFDSRKISDAIERALAYIVVDLETSVIIGATEAAHRLFGYPDQLLVGSNLEVLIPPESRLQHRNNIKKFRDNPSARAMGSLEMKLEGVSMDGKRLPVEICLIPEDVGPRSCAIAVILQRSSDSVVKRAN